MSEKSEPSSITIASVIMAIVIDVVAFVLVWYQRVTVKTAIGLFFTSTFVVMIPTLIGKMKLKP